MGEKGNNINYKNLSENRKNRGEVYTWNDDISYMTHTDRTFYLLSQYDLKYSEKEFFGIKLTDGIYDEDNMKYLKTYDIKKQKK